jgi:hypothetical protein
VVSWAGFNLAVGNTASLVYMAVGASLMFSWATERHKKYLECFDGRNGREAYPECRTAMWPSVGALMPGAVVEMFKRDNY